MNNWVVGILGVVVIWIITGVVVSVRTYLHYLKHPEDFHKFSLKDELIFGWFLPLIAVFLLLNRIHNFLFGGWLERREERKYQQWLGGLTKRYENLAVYETYISSTYNEVRVSFHRSRKLYTIEVKYSLVTEAAVFEKYETGLKILELLPKMRSLELQPYELKETLIDILQSNSFRP